MSLDDPTVLGDRVKYETWETTGDHDSEITYEGELVQRQETIGPTIWLVRWDTRNGEAFGPVTSPCPGEDLTLVPRSDPHADLEKKTAEVTDELYGRLEDHAQLHCQTAKQIDSHRRSLGQLDENQIAHGSRIGDVERGYQALSQARQMQREDIDGNTKRIETVEAVQRAQEQKLHLLEDADIAQHEAIERLEEKIECLTSRLGTVERDRDALQEYTTGLEGRLNVLELETLPRRVARLEDITGEDSVYNDKENQ